MSQGSGRRVEGVEGDARHVPPKQEAVQETVSSKEPRRDSRLYSQEEVQSHALLEEEEGAEERAEAEGPDLQPFNHSKATGELQLDEHGGAGPWAHPRRCDS